MVDAIVNEAPEAPRTAIDIADAIDKKLMQASAILSMMGLITEHFDEIPDATAPNAAWAARDLLKEVRDHVGELYALAKTAQPAQGVAQ